MTVAENVATVPGDLGVGPQRVRRASTSFWRSSACRPPRYRRAADRTSCRAGSASVSAWRARSRPIRRSSLLDEPFGALDAVTRFALQKEFRALQQRHRRTAPFVTHDLGRSARIADRVVVVADARARVARAGRPHERRSPSARALREPAGL